MDHVVIDGPPRVANLLRSALFACYLALIPVQPSPLDGWASAEMLKLIDQARIFKPEIGARFLLNRYHARTLIARATAESLAEHDRSEEHTSELQSLLRISYAVFCLKKKNK